MDIFWGSSQGWTIFRGQCILGSFLKVKVQSAGYYFGLLKFQIFLRLLGISDIF